MPMNIELGYLRKWCLNEIENEIVLVWFKFLEVFWEWYIETRGEHCSMPEPMNSTTDKLGGYCYPTP